MIRYVSPGEDAAIDVASTMETDASATKSTLKAGVGVRRCSLIKKNICGAANLEQ